MWKSIVRQFSLRERERESEALALRALMTCRKIFRLSLIFQDLSGKTVLDHISAENSSWIYRQLIEEKPKNQGTFMCAVKMRNTHVMCLNRDLP